MRVGFIVDGESEYHSLPKLLPQIAQHVSADLMPPLRANFHPEASEAAIAHACRARLEILHRKHADLIVLLLDREQQARCSPQVARALQQEIAKLTPRRVEIVVKNRMFENWLVADLRALRVQRGRFTVTNGMQSRVEPNKADNCDAVALLKQATRANAYEKVADSVRILARADHLRMAAHSRSFRRLLRVLEHPDFLAQSRSP